MQNLNFWLPREETKKFRLWDNLGYKIHLITNRNLKIAAILRTWLFSTISTFPQNQC